MYKKISLQFFAVIVAIAFFAALPAIVRATGYAFTDLFIGEEDFEGYAGGSDVIGKGTEGGWSSAWDHFVISGYATPAFYATTTNPIEGRQSLTLTWSDPYNNAVAERFLDSHTDGDVISVKMRSDNGNTGKNTVVLFRGNNAYYGWDVSLEGSGYITFASDSGTSNIQSYSANTVYTIDTQFDYTNSRARTRVNGGAWSSWRSSNTANSGVVSVWLEITDGGLGGGSTTAAWDDIRLYHEAI